MPYKRRPRGWRRVWHALTRPVRFLVFLTEAFLRGLVRVLVQLVRLVAGWWRRFDGWQLVRGLPALAALVGAVVLGVCCWQTAPAALVGPYRSAAARAFAAKDYQTARTCFDRLTLLEEDHPEHRWGLALAADALSEQDEFEAHLQELAPLGRQGYGPAHLLAAQRLLRRPTPTAEQRRDAEMHLIWADKALPESDEVRLVVGRYYLGRGKPDEAEPYLARAVAKHPELHLALAWLYAARGEKDRVHHHATAAAAYYRRLVEEDPSKQGLRFAWAEALGLLGDHSAAVPVLARGLELTQEPAFRKALAQTYVSWAEARARAPDGAFAERLALLERALALDGDNLGALNQLLALGRGTGDEAAKGRATLEAALARGQSSPLVHLALGMDAWQNGEHDKARLHLEQAHTLSPQSAVVTNNLAWLLAHAEKPDLERALALAEAALKSQPNRVAIRDTRGRILARMGRWKEALADLEAVLPALADDRELHRTLADVYEHLGNPSLAAEHKRLAEAKKPSAPAASGR
jgi:tetratricopeptide (TPR) repeat protein